MNNFYSSPEKYLERWVTPFLQQASQDHAVLVLTGARQVGKSALLLTAEPFRTWRYHSMDELQS
jgi:predicted AAA+ superfamily ATPase